MKDEENAMKNLLLTNFRFLTKAAARILLGFVLAAGTVNTIRAQGQVASGTLESSGSGPFVFDLSFADAAGATSPIGSVWYAWIPGHFYLPGVPTSATAPAGWTATVSGDSIQFVADSPANDIAPGQSLSWFSYDAGFTPAELAAAPDAGVSDAYSAGLFSDAGNIFTVQSVPEPSGQVLLLAGAAALGLIRWRRFLNAFNG
jgi:hypothetical protein